MYRMDKWQTYFGVPLPAMIAVFGWAFHGW
jgi:hypothetical protein